LLFKGSVITSTTRFLNISKEQITPLVAELLELIQLQMEEIQLLKDDIVRLKNQKPEPKIKPSRLKTTSNRKRFELIGYFPDLQFC